MESAEQPRTHPILIAAGVAVLLFSLLGAAALAQPSFAVGERVRISDAAGSERV